MNAKKEYFGHEQARTVVIVFYREVIRVGHKCFISHQLTFIKQSTFVALLYLKNWLFILSFSSMFKTIFALCLLDSSCPHLMTLLYGEDQKRMVSIVLGTTSL